MLKFTVFADAHYKKMMYPAKVSDVRAVLERAKESDSELVIHCGDLCNDYKGSPELTKALLDRVAVRHRPERGYARKLQMHPN